MTTGKNTNSNSLTTSCSFSPISLCHPAIMHRKVRQRSIQTSVFTTFAVTQWKFPENFILFFFSALGIKQRIDVTAFTGLWLNRRKELLLIIASEWGLAILGCPRDFGFYSCENISSRFLSICYPFCIIEVGPRSLSIEIGWKKISFICLFELDILLSNWSFFPPFFLLDTDE